jgi:hypothetical protein
MRLKAAVSEMVIIKDIEMQTALLSLDFAEELIIAFALTGG